MGALSYPSDLPGPTKAGHGPKARTRSSDLVGRSLHENFQADYTGTMDVEFYLTVEQLAAFFAWWEVDLLEGGRWFNCAWPALRPGSLVAQFTDRPSWSHVYMGSCRVSAKVQVRGVSQLVKAGTPELSSDYLWQTNPSSAQIALVAFANGNQRMVFTPGGVGNFFSNRSVTPITGRKYCELSPALRTSSLPLGFGVTSGDPTEVFYGDASGWSFFSGNGGCGLPLSSSYLYGTAQGGTWSFTQGDRLGIGFDADTREIWVTKNGVRFDGDPAGNANPSAVLSGSGPFYFYASAYNCFVLAPLQVDIYPRRVDQLYPMAGFDSYQPG